MYLCKRIAANVCGSHDSNLAQYAVVSKAKMGLKKIAHDISTMFTIIWLKSTAISLISFNATIRA